MSWMQYSVCDECGRALIRDASKKNANEHLRALGGYTYGGYHLCERCNTPVNRKGLQLRCKDKSK